MSAEELKLPTELSTNHQIKSAPVRPHLHPDWIDDHAYGIVKALQKAGFTSYLVGGCVRDLLLGVHPKDFDIATSAHPNQVKKLIHMAFVIGKRFRLVLVKRQDQQYEVATFRKDAEPSGLATASDSESGEDEMDAGQGTDGVDGPDRADGESAEGVAAADAGDADQERSSQLQTIKVDDNVFGSPEEDARRRDFTINALFYDPIAGKLIDYVNGAEDIDARILRMIGDPDVRLREDPIRMFRALRLSHKLKLSIEPTLRASILKNSQLSLASVLPRRREEFLKIMKLEEPTRALVEALDLGLLEAAFPTFARLFQMPDGQTAFEAHLESLRPLVQNWSSPLEVFFWSVSAMSLAFRELGESASPEQLHVSMRDELGMHKHEITTSFEAYRVFTLLGKSNDLKRKGDRRKQAMVARDGFDLALGLARTGLFLGAEDVAYWAELRSGMRDQIESKKASARHTRVRRNRRRSHKQTSAEGRT